MSRLRYPALVILAALIIIASLLASLGMEVR